MSLDSLLNQFLGTSASEPSRQQRSSQGLSGFGTGLAGGAAAGGIVALLLSSKKARKFTGKAAAVGGMALLGGIAYKAIRNWKTPPSQPTASPAVEQLPPPPEAYLPSAASNSSQPLELTIIKAMISAAKADGHIDQDEQKRIFEAVETMNMSSEHKAMIFDCMRDETSVAELAANVSSVEHRSEVYLAARMAIEPDLAIENAFLTSLAAALELPGELVSQLNDRVSELES